MSRLTRECVEQSMGSTKLSMRMFAKRPTHVAETHHQSIPLHVQNPPVSHLSWSVADSIIRTAATPSDERIWFTTTAPYRDSSAAKALYGRRDLTLDDRSSARLFGSDLQQLVQSEFAIDTGMSVEQFEETSPEVCYVKIFSVIESRNDELRRRVIAWPRSMNEAEHYIMNELAQKHSARIVFWSALQVRDRGVKFLYAASLDFKKFFQQFELLMKKCWAFIANSRVYLLSTIPTGAVFPPLFAQALSRSILSLAVRLAGVEDRVEHDCCIDNLRICSNDLDALTKAWSVLLSLCEHLGTTIGDMNPPPSTAVLPYTYLGMNFMTNDCRPQVELAMKSKKKLTSSAAALKSRTPLLVVDLLAIFGQTVWGCIVSGCQLGRLYYVLKFIRRLSSQSLEETVLVWPSIIDDWSNALIEMTTLRHEAPPTPTFPVFTDASESGWGVVIFNLGERPMRVFAGPWSTLEASESINMLELRALRIGLRILALVKSPSDVIDLSGFIDNTTARAWTLRRRAPKWKANQLALEIDNDLKKNLIVLRHLDYVESARNFADAPSRIHQRLKTASQLRPTGTAMMGGGGIAEAI